MKRLTAAALAAASLVALACEGTGGPSLELTVTGEGTPRGRAAIERSVDGHGTTDTIGLPYRRSYNARFVIVQVTAASGTVDCQIAYDGEVLARDSDPKPGIATCSAEVPGGAG